jgi:hypothetical protein
VCFRGTDRFSDVVTHIGNSVTKEVVMKGKLAVAAGVVATVAFSCTQSTRAQTHAGLDTAAIEQGTGLKGLLLAEESVFKVTTPRTDVKIQVDHWTMPPGDFAMLEAELQPVLRSMRNEGINIVAIHQHMSGEQPRYFFLHYWGTGKAVDLAQSLQRVAAAKS